MKVVAINGSPREKGNSFQVIKKLKESLEEEGVAVEVLQIGSKDIKGCIACGGCKKAGKCILDDIQFHTLAQKIYEADGIFIVAPVYYCGIPGQLKTFLDRLFFQDRSGGGLRHKVASIASVQRRTGGVATLDNLYHFLLAAGMIIAPSVGENLIYGMEENEVLLDVEGMDIVYKLGKNMAWLLKVLNETKDSITPPIFFEREYLNFIRK